MKSLSENLKHSYFKKSLLSALIAASSAQVVAQGEPATEEVVVLGVFERNLNNALNLKRESTVIADGISADDIGSLPALDMGEALQAVPGVQLNREGERRESSVNLRGLPSGFIKTTANGQSIAAPTRGSQSDLFGAANPYGAYDPSIFSGITAIKTQDASMQEGGIAGTVDLKLRTALSAKEGGSVQLGYRYEELTSNGDPEIAASGSYHLIEDVLAVTGAIGYSKQSWRNDSVRVVRYNNIIDGTNYNQGSSDFATLEDWKDANNLPDNASVIYPGEVRQGSEINEGDRLSASANIEFQATDELTLGASLILTDRNMDDNRYEQIELRAREYTHVGVTPTHAPVNVGVTNADGGPVYMVPGVELENTRYFYDNRQYNFYQNSQALIFDAEWTNDEWVIDGAVTLSEAENVWDEILISPRAESDSEADAVFFSGLDNYENWSMQVTDFDTAINFDEWEWNTASRELVTNSGAVPAIPGGNVLLLTGTYDTVKNDLNAGEINFERLLGDEGITSVSFGLRKSTEKMESGRVRVSGADVDPTGIFTEAGKIPASSNGNYFGGNISGAADVNDGWYSFDFNQVNSALQATIRDDISTLPPRGIEEASLTPNGYIARANELGKGYDFTSELDITALYAMADFEVGVARGNFGLRYVDTSIDTVAPTYDKSGSTVVAQLDDAEFSNSYTHILPSANINFDLTDEIVLRTSYNETFVRPNMRAATPEARVLVSESGDTFEATLPGTELEPFEAQSFDLSLEWYTGDTGVVSLAYYNKNIDNYFVRDQICEQIDGYDLGTLTFDSAAGTCTSAGGGSENLIAGADVDITAYINTDSTINVEGVEFSVQQKLKFLPAPWDGFGGVFNYTTSSQSSDVGADEDPIEIYGISDNSYNLIAFYETSDWGLRFAYNWRSDYDILATNTLFGEGISTVSAVSRLDLSAYINITRDLTVRLKGYNLTEEVYQEYQDIEAQMRRADFEGRTWQLSVGYKF